MSGLYWCFTTNYSSQAWHAYSEGKAICGSPLRMSDTKVDGKFPGGHCACKKCSIIVFPWEYPEKIKLPPHWALAVQSQTGAIHWYNIIPRKPGLKMGGGGKTIKEARMNARIFLADQMRPKTIPGEVKGS